MNTEYENESRYVSLAANDQYVREVRRVERLTSEEEAVLIQRLRRGKAEQKKVYPNQWVLMLAREARTRLVEEYQGVVLAIVVRYRNNPFGMEVSDLVQEGNLGLLRALDDGTFETGKHLNGLVKICVRAEIINAFRDRGAVIRPPRRVSETFTKMLAVKRELRSVLGREPVLGEVAQRMGIAEEKLAEVVETIDTVERVKSIQGMRRADGEEVEEDCLDFVSLYQGAYAQEDERSQQLEQAVKQALEQVLSPRQREVMQLRYGVGGGPGGGYTQIEVAKQFGVTDRAIYQCEQKAKQRLQGALAPVVESRAALRVGVA